MKTAIKLVLIYLGIQILSTIVLTIPYAVYLTLTGGDIAAAQTAALPPSLLLSILLMLVYLYKYNYISREKLTWSIVSPSYLVLTVVATLSAIWLLDALTAHLHLPDLLKNTFDLLQGGWMGIVTIAVVGPVLEELLFRGAITKLLLQRYTPLKAILLSALIFGVFHLNPAQVVSAGLVGLLLAWVYYRTASLLPCILIHIINNSLSVYFSLRYPGAEHLNEVIGGSEQSYWLLTVAMLVLFTTAYLLMRRTTVAYPWREEPNNEKRNLES